MSTLLHPSGTPFATGECRCTVGVPSGDRLTRLRIPLLLDAIRTDAVVDTGGAYLILPPELADVLGLEPDASHGRERISVRGIATDGWLHRCPVTLPAARGEAFTFQATAFVPSLRPGEEWLLPLIAGWFGCLERFRFAVDPVNERLYFGEAEPF